MNPPRNAIVLSFDEKSQIQALDRTEGQGPVGGAVGGARLMSLQA